MERRGFSFRCCTRATRLVRKMYVSHTFVIIRFTTFKYILNDKQQSCFVQTKLPQQGLASIFKEIKYAKFKPLIT